MSKIEREMIAEARAARESAQSGGADAKHGADGGIPLTDADLGVDVPSAPDDEQIEHAWQYARIMGTVPPLCEPDNSSGAAQQALIDEYWRRMVERNMRAADADRRSTPRSDDAIPQVHAGVPASGRPKWWDDKDG